MDDEGRYRLTLTMGGRRTMRGWWADETAARGQIRVWVRNWGVPGARITLLDEETGAMLAEWPEEPQPAALSAAARTLGSSIRAAWLQALASP